MPTKIRTHFLFDGAAEEAMNYYVDLFANSKVLEARRFESGAHDDKLEYGRFTVRGQEFSCGDSPLKLEFGFTPAMSIFIDFDDSAEQERMYTALMTGGKALMPLDNYEFSKQFAWIEDRFGVSWQLNLP